jgi:predicted nucleotide-binding protein (sugar kinase/HSP70/actin superfamily)
VARHRCFTAPGDFRHVASLSEGVIGHGCKMGEGWLLTAEMMELIELGYENIITVQPFGCLPNHIIAKGMSRKIRALRPQANIMAVDYDPGATQVNQENRIKLMLELARERLNLQEIAQKPAQ